MCDPRGDTLQHYLQQYCSATKAFYLTYAEWIELKDKITAFKRNSKYENDNFESFSNPTHSF